MGIDSPILTHYINNRNEVLLLISTEEKCDQTEAKQKFVSVIYGSKKNKGQYLQHLYYEIFNNINKLIYRVEYNSIVEKVKAEKKK